MKLIVHIGAGKTGSTSIQSTLRVNDQLLQSKGVLYLGLMLERTQFKSFDWQRTSSVVMDFHQLTPNDATEQLLQVFRPIINDARSKGINTLVWSNESFLGSNHNYLGALQQLILEGIDVEILAYVREYASWTKSAYVQWGIKHKTYKGKLKTFHEWSQSNYPAFYQQMKDIVALMPNRMHVRNMNAANDIVVDFFDYANIDIEGIQICRDNDAPKNEELLLRALYNSKYEGQILPVRFDSKIGKNISFSQTPTLCLENLMPTVKELEGVLSQTVDDQVALNKLLKSQGQEELVYKQLAEKSTVVDNEKLLLAVAEIMMNQAKRIDKLESDLAKIIKN